MHPHTLRIVFLAWAAACLLYGAMVVWPLAMQGWVVGFGGTYRADAFRISATADGSPAEQSGLRRGDVVVALNDRSTRQWWAWYQSARSRYLREISTLREAGVRVEREREGRRDTVVFSPRPVAPSDFLASTDIRIVLAIMFLCLGLLLVFARSRDPTARFIAIGYAAAAFWFVTISPRWNDFFLPVIPHVAGASFAINAVVEVVALQLTMSMLVHIALIFPERHAALRRYPLLPWPIYLAPSVLLAAIAAGSDGPFVDRLAVLHSYRLWVNTVLVVCATFVLLHAHRTCRSALQRERTRWVVAAFAACTVWHITVWNVPKLLLGSGLFANYDWVLVPFVLIPVAMTAAISSHRLFGIRGIARRRLRMLRALLERERAQAERRGRHIQSLQSEIETLRAELDQFVAAEQAADGGIDSRARLESRYPALRAARERGFVCASPAWNRVFEQLLIGARGMQPVLIIGESGTGKTDCARLVHDLGDRPAGPYREISCAQFEHADPAIPLGRLFGIGVGHGLANVARDGQRGLLEEVHGGSLFLDDFDRLPLNVQDLLLFPLEGKAFEPGIGTGPPRRVSVKFVAATNRSPAELVRSGGLRADVLARFVAHVEVPPLRNRREDVPPLVRHFVDVVARELGHEISVVSANAMRLLAECPFPSGNARELKAEITAAVGKAMLEEDVVLRAGYLSESVRNRSGTAPALEEAGALRSPGVSRELAALRRNGFLVRASEQELGLSQRSRTLSAHLRGMCLQALVVADFSAQRAAVALSASEDPVVIARVERKIRRFARTVRESVELGMEQRLFRKTPAAYHDALRDMIARVRMVGAA
jgi:DNA-binding NtrC family response regulator